MPFDFDAAVGAPFRMQPGLRRLGAGTPQLTPLRPGTQSAREKLAVLSQCPGEALLVQPDFDAAPALAALCAQAACEWPDAFAWDGATAHAPQIGWSVGEDRPCALRCDADPAIGACLEALPARWRLAGLLALSFAEDLAIIDAKRGTIAWMAVCLPSHWSPREKIGRNFAEVHAPVADNALLLKAADHLVQLVSRRERWERFVWNVSPHAHLNAHLNAHLHAGLHAGPLGPAARRWPLACTTEALAALAHWRTEHQTFIPLAALGQAIFTIHVALEPLALAICTRERAALLHAAVASMSDAVLAYRDLAAVRQPLLDWLAARAA